MFQLSSLPALYAVTKEPLITLKMICTNRGGGGGGVGCLVQVSGDVPLNGVVFSRLM